MSLISTLASDISTVFNKIRTNDVLKLTIGGFLGAAKLANQEMSNPQIQLVAAQALSAQEGIPLPESQALVAVVFGEIGHLFSSPTPPPTAQEVQTAPSPLAEASVLPANKGFSLSSITKIPSPGTASAAAKVQAP